MKVHTEIIQGSPEWHQLRYGKIGGSDAKGLWVKSGTLLTALVAELTEPFDGSELEDQYLSPDMERGYYLEPIARKELSLYTGYNFMEVGYIESGESKLIGISPDGITPELDTTCEIKCPSKEKHMEILLTGKIPLIYITQCIWYFVAIPGLKKHVFGSYRPEAIKPMWYTELTKESVVNIGTEAKPKMETIGNCVDQLHEKIKELEINIEETIKILQF